MSTPGKKQQSNITGEQHDVNMSSKSFTKAFNEIVNAFNSADEDDEPTLSRCLADARDMLADEAIPRFHKIKVLLLLASMVADYDEAFQFHFKADIQLRVVRAYGKKGETSPDIDAVSDELKASVDNLRRVLAEEDAARHMEMDDSADYRSDDFEEALEIVIAKREKRAADKAQTMIDKRQEKSAAAKVEEEEEDLASAGPLVIRGPRQA